MQHNRRDALQLVAVALTAGAAAAGTDPVLALIDAHRKATALHGATLVEQARYEQGGVSELPCDEAAEAACHADVAAWRKFVSTPPQTVAGLKAWASYLDEVRETESWMVEDEGLAIVKTLVQALAQCA